MPCYFSGSLHNIIRVAIVIVYILLPFTWWSGQAIHVLWLIPAFPRVLSRFLKNFYFYFLPIFRWATSRKFRKYSNYLGGRGCNRAKVPSDYVIARIYTILQHLFELPNSSTSHFANLETKIHFFNHILRITFWDFHRVLNRLIRCRVIFHCFFLSRIATFCNLSTFRSACLASPVPLAPPFFE